MGSEQNDGTSYSPSEPKLCANGCGFFGTAANMNLCSKGYRDHVIKEEQAASAKAAMEKTLSFKKQPDADYVLGVAPLLAAVDVQEVVVSGPVRAESSSSSSSSSPAAAAPVAEVKLASRCLTCNKKVGLTGFKCKCGSTFCGNHRYPENHGCTFDFKGSGRDAIAKANPVIKADKVERF